MNLYSNEEERKQESKQRKTEKLFKHPEVKLDKNAEMREENV